MAYLSSLLYPCQLSWSNNLNLLELLFSVDFPRLLSL